MHSSTRGCRAQSLSVSNPHCTSTSTMHTAHRTRPPSPYHSPRYGPPNHVHTSFPHRGRGGGGGLQNRMQLRGGLTCRVPCTSVHRASLPCPCRDSLKGGVGRGTRARAHTSVCRVDSTSPRPFFFFFYHTFTGIQRLLEGSKDGAELHTDSRNTPGACPRRLIPPRPVQPPTPTHTHTQIQMDRTMTIS